MTGFGKMFYKNGDIYEGQWLNDKRHGKGSFIFEDGTSYVGEWRDDMYQTKFSENLR